MMGRFFVWGCGDWPKGRRLVADGGALENVPRGMPICALLPEAFAAAWAASDRPDHWAVIITCEQDALDTAARTSPNVDGWQVIPAAAGRN